MISTLQFFFYISTILLIYIWLLFPVTVFLVSKFQLNRKLNISSDYQPHVTVLVACLNEESTIKLRISNLFASDYPSHKLEIVVISDGSTDNTARNAASMATTKKQIKVIENERKSGRAFSHNAGVRKATGEILIFTDAGTSFDNRFITEITRPFAEIDVGFATGQLNYINKGTTVITKSAGLYWQFEQALRVWESICGLNVFGSGACCGMRRKLYRDVPPTGDVDFTSPLDAALQGYRCVHIPAALAYDEMPANQKNELSARIRMTSKNFKGTLERWGWYGITKFPILTWVILSHKYGRWITPFLLIFILLSSIGSFALIGGSFFGIVLGAQAVFYILGLLGYFRPGVPLGNTVYSFLLGNYGMLLGVVKVLRGKVESSYTPIRNDPE